jgi:hypothetical protein
MDFVASTLRTPEFASLLTQAGAFVLVLAIAVAVFVAGVGLVLFFGKPTVYGRMYGVRRDPALEVIQIVAAVAWVCLIAVAYRASLRMDLDATSAGADPTL